jgi:hypothetical protein
MNQRIVYPNGNGISIVCPTGSLPLAEIAKKDVPAGVPYIIIDASELPSDRQFRNAWTADFSEPDGYGMGHDAWAAQYIPEAE